jgi:hypothetical protein
MGYFNKVTKYYKLQKSIVPVLKSKTTEMIINVNSHYDNYQFFERDGQADK